MTDIALPSDTLHFALLRTRNLWERATYALMSLFPGFRGFFAIHKKISSLK
jgi:hypothetical protein